MGRRSTTRRELHRIISGGDEQNSKRIAEGFKQCCGTPTKGDTKLMQTTMEEVRSLVKVLEELVQPLLEGDVVEDTYESNKRPHLVLQEGSKTYGRAYRIHFTGGSKYGSGHWEPRGFSDYLGGTKAEAAQSLRKLIAGIRTGLLIAEQKEVKA